MVTVSEVPGEERWFQAFREQAARMAFPDWKPQPGEWVSLYTSLVGPYPAVTTEIAVYRGTQRVRFHRFTGKEAQTFWLELMRRSPVTVAPA